MDLNSLKTVKADKGATMEVVHPATEEVIPGLTITLLGHDSAVYRKIQNAKNQAIINRMTKGKKIVDLDVEKLAEATIDDLVKLTVKWTGFEMDGKPLEPTPENFALVYNDPLLAWIKDQALEFVANRANFFR